MTSTRPKRDGMIRPYRPRPADFRAVYVQIGWDGITDHFRTNWRVICRWIEEEGREGLQAERAAFVAAERRTRAKRYVLGRTLTAVKPGKRKG